MRLSNVVLIGVTVGFIGAMQPALADGSLDGKAFIGQLISKSEQSAETDTFEFTQGKFHSAACDKYGFSSAAYTARPSGDRVHFQAMTRSADSTMTWTGTVEGDYVSGTAVLTENGKTTDYAFAGDLKK
jgi:hypothetical protein